MRTGTLKGRDLLKTPWVGLEIVPRVESVTRFRRPMKDDKSPGPVYVRKPQSLFSFLYVLNTQPRNETLELAIHLVASETAVNTQGRVM